MAQKIGGVWAAFLGGERAKVNSAPDAPCLGLYTNYDWADVSYDMLAATQGETCPEGFRRVEIPAGKYAKFTFHGDVQKATAEAWGIRPARPGRSGGHQHLRWFGGCVPVLRDAHD